MENIVFCKIQDLLKNYYLFTTVKDNGEDGFHLILCDGNDSWEGDISGNDIHDMCSLSSIDYKDYVEMTVQALTGKSGPNISFQYQIDHSSQEYVQFHWKKHIVSDDVKFRLGSTKLSQSDDSNKTIQKIFDHCIEKISNLNHKITTTQMDNERLSQERANALKTLNNCVSAKEKLEEDLYSKFLMVLNSKKKEIENLRQKVEEQKQDHTEADNSNEELTDDENSSSYSAETEKDGSDTPNTVGGKKAKWNDSLVFTDDSPDEDMDNLSRIQKPEIKQDKKSNASTSKVSSEYDKSKKIVKMKEEKHKRSFGKKSASDLTDTNDLLDDF